jgi:hypothetical protein
VGGMKRGAASHEFDHVFNLSVQAIEVATGAN